jgi:DNA-binding XRE family transcriptional regulator
MEQELRGAGEVPGADGVPVLPVLQGFREMALRRMSAERRRLVADLATRRRSAGLSQTEVAARMGTSQSAVARLETGDADVRVSTLERYAAAIGSQLEWQARARPGEDLGSMAPGPVGPDVTGPGMTAPDMTGADMTGPGLASPGHPQAGQPQAGLGQEYR